VSVIEQLGRNTVERLNTTPFGQRQNAMGVAVEGKGDVELQLVGDVEELSTNGLDAGFVSSRRPLHLAANRRILPFVDRGQKPFERVQRRYFKETMQRNAVLE